MLNHVLLAGAMIVAAPAIAQTVPQTATIPAPTVATGTAAPTAPATTANTAPTAPQSTPTTAQAAPTEQVATGSQVAQVIDAEFPTYDKDSDGNLNATEFGAWMVALKTKSDPTTKADSAATKKWNNAAFGQADADKSKSVSKTELTSFLSKG